MEKQPKVRLDAHAEASSLAARLVDSVKSSFASTYRIHSTHPPQAQVSLTQAAREAYFRTGRTGTASASRQRVVCCGHAFGDCVGATLGATSEAVTSLYAHIRYMIRTFQVASIVFRSWHRVRAVCLSHSINEGVSQNDARCFRQNTHVVTRSVP